jgi:hypothetical protein
MTRLLFLTMSVVLFFTGCAFKAVTFYDPCFDHNITLHFKNNQPIYIMEYEDSPASRYSSVETDTARVICTGNDCADKDWSLKRIGYTGKGYGFTLTGRYAFSESRMMMSWFVSDNGFLQGYVGKHQVWIPLYLIRTRDVIDEDHAEVEYILSATESAKDGFWIASEFKCPTGVWPEFMPLINSLD